MPRAQTHRSRWGFVRHGSASASPDATEQNPPDLLTKMQCDLGYLAMFRAVEAVGGTEYGLPWDPSKTRPLPSRKQLLKRIRDFAEQYPASRYVPYSKEVAAMLESMIVEDEAHVFPTDNEMEHMFVEQQAHELIFSPARSERPPMDRPRRL